MLYRVLPLFVAAVCLGSTIVPSSTGDARSEYQRLATAGNCRAQTVLARLANREGRRSEALSWYRLAAAQGDAEAQVSLGDIYVTSDTAQAVVWYEQASSSSADALWKLGRLYENGEGVRADLGLALTLYEHSAAQGHAGAQNSLGNLALLAGDHLTALRWYRKAVESGSGEALLNLAGMYWQGVGVPKDPSLARQCAAAAVRQGVRDARLFLMEFDRADRP